MRLRRLTRRRHHPHGRHPTRGGDCSRTVASPHRGLPFALSQARRPLGGAEDDVLAYLAFPPEHWRRICSNKPLERLNRAVKRRTDVVEAFPNEAAMVRLVGLVLAERHDSWQVTRCHFSAESLAKLTLTPAPRAIAVIART